MRDGFRVDGTDTSKVLACYSKAQVTVRSASYGVGVIVALSVILPVANRTYLERGTFAECSESAARTAYCIEARVSGLELVNHCVWSNVRVERAARSAAGAPQAR
jgi:hypothetical protein